MTTTITISLPTDIAANIAMDDGVLSRKTLEALAIESYREGDLSIGQLAEVLGFSVLEAEDFLNGKDVPLNYSLSDLEEDIETIKNLK
jgi:predicted HTH domain antitoxin